MIDFTINNLRDHYDSIYPKPQSDQEAIALLYDVCCTELKDSNPSVKEGIGEIYRELLGKGLPSYYWMLEGIHRTAKKKEEKRHFGYVVGTLRNWALYGFGNTLTDEEEEIFDYFKEITNVNLSPDSRKIISALMGRYGAFKLMRNMPLISDIDLSIVLAETLAKNMMERYDESPAQALVAPAKEVLLTNGEIKTKLKKKQTKQNDSRKEYVLQEKTKLMILYIEEYLQLVSTYARPTDIANFLIEKGYTNITPRNITSHLLTAMKHNENIVKVGTGKYQYKKKK